MILRKYGIELHSLTQNDLEMVRSWRNDDFVRGNMFYKEEISASDQQDWFSKLDQTMIYLCIRYQGEAIGLINVKNVDWEERTGEAGIFIGVPHYRNSHIPMLAVLCLMDVFFEEFHFAKLLANVRADNASALNFNQQLGYSIHKTTEELIELQVDYTAYAAQRARLTKLLVKLNQNAAEHAFSDDEKNYLFPRK
jgi:RimJ/RimL family protein N-acetyltransferase